MSNLIENAIKFTHAGDEVKISSWRNGREVGITVADTGPELPPGGSGLGLAICREIAAAHGGRVRVEAREGQGSAFSIALPANGTAVAVVAAS